ncbi:CDP-alcohol phosphatidyltransferase family protein [Pseudohalocynthiibacter sp. F2068]|uniref:CDP-alcohol phosphatidyltransferase family protein n=1 Tax=Pseudohalocynthiibacter sp. F2068 TaxID=2926418 RepID=UPI001FF6C9A2|nr:CDP-alcohol phosphatidyltransferase family protein [Pseudohalocynthiibacter sp. F2068]
MAKLQTVHGVYNPACLITMFGAFASCLSICFSVSELISLSLVALILAGLADLFDGYVARKLDLNDFEKAFGVQLDTVVDVVSFVAAPAVIGFAISGGSLWAIVCIVLFMLAGLVRLAHFNTDVGTGHGAVDSHLGLPVTYAALVLPVVLFPMLFMGPTAFQFVLGAVFLSLAVLFITPVTVPKPRGVFYVLFAVLAVLFVSLWSWNAISMKWSFV